MERPSDIFDHGLRSQLLKKSNARALGLLLSTWAVIFGVLWLAGTYPNPATIILALVVLPGRQLSLAVLMHEGGHGSLFRSQWANQWVVQWFCALPTLGDLESYARGHAAHHRLAGTENDPDLPNYQAYPVSRDSFRRKVIRDLTGQTGFKLVSAVFLGATGIVGDGQRQGFALLLKQIAAQVAVWTLLTALGVGWTWWLWFASFMTGYMLIIRLRQIAEHAAVPDLMDLDPRLNTRTVVAPAWQHFLLAPSYVNYHMEHHYMPGVPCYRLPLLRAALLARGLLDDVIQDTDYGQVFRRVVRAS